MKICKNYRPSDNNFCLNCKHPLASHIVEHNLELYELVDDDFKFEQKEKTK